jgi:hypothetical protein
MLLQRILIANVCFHEGVFRIGKSAARTLARLNRGIVEIIEVVNDRDFPVALGEQALNQMRADETRAAGN